MKTDPEFKGLLVPLKPQERAALEESLISDGCRDPLVVWKGHGVLLDGHNRLQICEAHGLSYKIKRKELPDRRAARIWIRDNQRARRNLTKSQLAVLAAKNAEEFEAQARERQGARTDLDPDLRQQIAESSPDPDAGRANARAGDAFGVSREYVRRARSLPEHLSEQVLVGKMTLAEAADRETIGRRVGELPEDERERADAFLESLIIAGNHTSSVLEVAGNLLTKPTEERIRIYSLHENGGERDHSLAVTSAASLPPMPHPALKLLVNARRSIRKAQKHLEGPTKERADEIHSDIVSLETVIEAES